MQTLSFLDNVKQNEPKLWEIIVNASKEGVILIDEQNDSIVPTNRLLWTYPDLHETLMVLINSWSEKNSNDLSKLIFNEILKELKDEQNANN